MNPYYDSDQLGWQKLEAENTDLYYEFDICCFWKTKTGEIYHVSDSGCSCPTPFKNYEADTASTRDMPERRRSFLGQVS